MQCKKGLWRLLVPVLLIAVLLTLTAPAAADQKTTTWVFRVTRAEEDCDGTDLLRSVLLYQKSVGQLYLFLPAGWDASSLRLWFDEPSEVSLKGETVHSGDAVSFFVPGKSISMKAGRKTVKVTTMQADSLPTVFLTTASGSADAIHASKKNEEEGTVLLTDADGTTLTEQHLTSLRCRGNTSFSLPRKKSYQFKLEKGEGLLGMDKSKTWVVTSGYRDRTFIRNKITYDMALYVGIPYAIESRLVNVYMNGDYRGVFSLCEKVQISSSGVNIGDLEKATEKVNDSELSAYERLGQKELTAGGGKWSAIPNDPEDISGGYLVCYENAVHYRGLSAAYVTDREVLVAIKEPDYVSEAQYSYISSLLQSFENAIFAEDGIDPTTGKHYTEIADFDSLVLKYVLE